MSFDDLTRLVKRYRVLYLVLFVVIAGLGIGTSYMRSRATRVQNDAVSIAANISFHDGSEYATKETDYNVAALVNTYVFDNMSSDHVLDTLKNWFKQNAPSASMDKPVKISNTLTRVDVTASNTEDLTKAVGEVSSEMRTLAESKGATAQITEEPVQGDASPDGVSLKKKVLRVVGIAAVVPVVIIALVNSFIRRYANKEQLEHDTGLPVLLEYSDVVPDGAEFDYAVWSELGSNPKTLFLTSIEEQGKLLEVAQTFAQYYAKHDCTVALVTVGDTASSAPAHSDLFTTVSFGETECLKLVDNPNKQMIDGKEYDYVMYVGANLSAHPYLYKIAHVAEASVLVESDGDLTQNKVKPVVERFKKIKARLLGFVLLK